MRPSNEELQQLDRDLDDLHREMIVMRREEFERDFLQRYHSNSLMCQQEEVKSPTSDPFGDIWGRTRSVYMGTPHDLVNTNWGVPTALAAWDVKNISALIRDIGWGTKLRHSVHQGRQYIILTGYPGLRRKLKGTRYGLTSTKLIEVGIGKYGIRGSSIKGLKISCHVAAGIEISEWIFGDEKIMTDLLGGIGVELIKAGIAAAVGFAVTAIIGTFVSAAALPIAIGAITVLVVGIGLNALDSHFKIKSSIKSGLRYAAANIESIHQTFSEIRQEHLQNYAEKKILDVGDQIIEGIYQEAKSWIIHQINHGQPFKPYWPEAPRLPSLPNFNPRGF